MTSVPNNIPFKISTSDPTAFIRESKQLVIGQLGQALDGRIATSSGDSKYINGSCGLMHLHRLRDAVDAVIVGVESVNQDNPKLTVRHCGGSDPVKVIMDPNGRVNMEADVFKGAANSTIIVTSKNTDHAACSRAKVIKLDCDNGYIAPKAIVQTLAEQGYTKLLVEGGNRTLSNFIRAGAVDRLHLIVAPMIIGAGIQGLDFPGVDKLREAIRPEVTLYPLGTDILFDCNLVANVTRPAH